MADTNHVVYAILKFLDDQQRSPDLTPDAIESLEVASQCLESAYGISIRDVDAIHLYPLPGSLQQIFSAGLMQLNAPAASVADREAAEKLKGEGNELMRQEQYSAAVESYTRAIQLDSRNAVYYCNRAAAYGKMGEHQKSINDCRKALEIDPKYGKAYGRMGLAHTAMGAHIEAKTCYQRALELDPVNDTYRENLRQCEQLTRDENGMGSMPGALGGLNLGGLDLSSMLSNPALMNMATSMLSNPQMQQMMANMMSGGVGGGQSSPGPQGMSSLLQASLRYSGNEFQTDGPATEKARRAKELSRGMSRSCRLADLRRCRDVTAESGVQKSVSGQQLAQQMQQSNPELVEQLRSQMRGQSASSDNTSNDQSPPDGNPPSENS